MKIIRTMDTQQRHKEILAWWMWGVLVLAYVIAFFHRLSLAVIMDYLIVDLQIGEAALAGALAGSYAIIYMFMQIPTGLLVESWGPRKTASAGMLVACAGSFLFALAPSLLFAFIGRIMIGLGVSVIFVCILKFQVNWFKPSRFATITGLTGFVGNSGVALGTTPLALLVTYYGWRKTYLVFAVVTVLVTICCWLFVRDTYEETSERLSLPLKAGDLTSRKASATATLMELLQALKNVIHNSQTWFIFIAYFGLYGTLLAFTGAWSVTYLMQIYGFARGTAANYMLVFAVGHMLGLPLAGYVTDRLGKRRLPLLFSFVLYLAVWGLFFVWNGGKPPVEALYPLFFCIGFTCCAPSILLSLSKEVNDPQFAGVALSVVNVSPFAGMAFLQPLLGYVLDLRWDGLMVEGMKIYPLESYRLLFAVCVFTVLVCLIFTFRVKETNCRNIRHK